MQRQNLWGDALPRIRTEPFKGYAIRYTLYAIRYTLYAIRYTLYAIRYTLYAIRYTLYAIRYTLLEKVLPCVTNSFFFCFNLVLLRKT